MNMGDRPLSLPADVGCLVPHREPIRFVDRLIECAEDSVVAEAVLKADNVLADVDGSIHSVIFIELIAQTYAAFKGYLEGAGGNPARKGFLVAVRDLVITGALAVGDRAIIKVKTGTTFGAFAVIDGTVIKDGVRLASANLKLWTPDEQSQDK
jgi:predicted hotdog family 3-hydroxylacyl-ACP dehydratase